MVESAVAKKLKLKAGLRAAVINEPPGYSAGLAVTVETDLTGKADASLDFIQLFVKTLSEAEALVPEAMRILKHDGLLWLAYPKGTSKIKTDLSRDILWKAMEKHGLAGVAMVSLDDVWSAMRFRPANKVGK